MGLEFDRPKIMGILNVTPDSFMDGGNYFEVEDSIRHAYRLLENGADIIDVGGESTRPGAQPVSEGEELRRVLPIVSEIVNFGVPISIDTYKPEVARRCLDLGVTLVNDVYSLRKYGMAEVVKEYEASVILTHMPGTPQTMKGHVYSNILEEITEFFKERINYALDLGIDKIILDPGFGFGKNPEENNYLLRNLDFLHQFECGVMVGTFGKSFCGKSMEEVLIESLRGGAKILRVHDPTIGCRARRIFKVFG